MKIALLTPYFLPTIGGSEQYVYDLARFLSKRGHEVSILTTNLSPGKKVNISAKEQISSIIIRRFKVMEFTRKLTRVFVSMYIPYENVAKEVTDMDFDVLHFHNVTDLTFPVILWKLKAPKVLTCHTLYEVTQYHWLLGPRMYFFRKVLNHMNILHVLSQKDFVILDRMGIDRRKIAVIPPGVNLENFYASPERNGEVILFVGRISPEKNLETLLEALLKVKSKYKLWLVGPIQDQSYFFWLKKKYLDSSDNKIKIFGSLQRNELLKCYAQADLFVLPSRMETFGLVLLEAMASRLPVISTNVGVAKELIKDWQNGFVVPIGDSKALAEKIDLLIANKDLRDRIGENNRKLIEKKFDANTNFSKLLELYVSQLTIKGS
jgi:glycosyltransferase involved in cell wall biosynthesis